MRNVPSEREGRKPVSKRNKVSVLIKSGSGRRTEEATESGGRG